VVVSNTSKWKAHQSGQLQEQKSQAASLLIFFKLILNADKNYKAMRAQVLNYF
jgi:hypothetical protein